MTSAPNTFDGRPGSGAAIGVVPVCHDDREAPAGCAALRELQGRALLLWSVEALLRSPTVGRVVVSVPPVLVPLVERLLGDHVVRDLPPRSGGMSPSAPKPQADQFHVLPVRQNGHGFRVREVLARTEWLGDGPVVVHDPLYPLAPPGLVTAVVEALLRDGGQARDGVQALRDGGQARGGQTPDGQDPGQCVVAVPVRPVTDTLKWIDEDDVVLGTADRDQFRMVYSPQAYWPAGLRGVLAGAGPEQLRAEGADVLPRLVQATGGRLLPVPAPGEVFRLSTEEDLVLADAMLHVAGSADGRSGTANR